MYSREHHQRIAEVLTCLDTELLSMTHCYFGGGTAIALKYGEIRVSTDIDFLVSDRTTYRTLREQISDHGIGSLFSTPVHIAREPIADQYGIRTLIGGSEPIKFEIIHEGRIDLDPPASDDRVCGVECLTAHDLVASKLLANDDRWADRGLFSRDLIDLAIMAPTSTVWRSGMRKAADAYGRTVRSELIRAIDTALDTPGWLAVCIDALQMQNITTDELISRVTYLRELT